MSIIQHNLQVLIDLESKHIGNFSTEIVKKIKKRITFAAIKILKDVEPYILGKKKIEACQIQKIETAFFSLKDVISQKAQAKEQRLASKAHRLMAALSEIRDGAGRPNSPRTGLTRDDIQNDYYQIMACAFAYGKAKVGDEVLGPFKDTSNYIVEEVITNQRGLQIILLVSKEKSLSPLICCRGTIPNPHNFLDDMNKHIGEYSFSLSKEKLLESLQKISVKYGPAVVVGHSLGGAIAQNIAVEFCDKTNDKQEPLIKEIYHYNAPGVGDEIAKKYKQKYAQLPAHIQPKIIAFRHAADFVSLAGGAHLEPVQRYDVDRLHLHHFFSHDRLKAVHSLKTFASHKNKSVLFDGKLKLLIRKVIEIIRRFFSFIGRAIVMFQIQTKEQRKIMVIKLRQFIDTHEKTTSKSTISHKV